MSSDEMRELQDYLDGRLGEESRKTFEARMANDPELSARVAFSRKIGHVLRQDSAQLPAGFLGRARRRFEEAHAPRPRSAHVFYLKAAGLAVAAGLVVVLLLPLGRRSPDDFRPETAASSSLSSSTASKDEADDALVPPVELRRAPRNEPEPARERKQMDSSAAPAAPPPETQAALRMARRGERQDAVAQAAPSDPQVRCEDLPEDSRLLPESLLVITDHSNELWKELNSGSSALFLERLAPDFQRERVVLMGSPAGCRGLEVHSDPEKVQIRLGTHGMAAGGCAVTIPAGTAPIEIEKAADEPQ